jgi:hypothetical protein
MDIAFDHTPDGYRNVIWIQMLPRTTKGGRLRWQAILGGMILGALLGWASLKRIDGLLMGAFFGGGVGGILFQKSMQGQDQQEWGRAPITAPSQGQAFARPSQTGEMTFTWFFDTPDGGRLGDSVPLASFDSFEVGSLNEWFAGPEDRRQFGDCLAIVLHSESHGTKCVAAHAGSRAEIAQLHAVLTPEFVLNRAQLALSASREPQTPARASRHSDDIPKSL